MINKIFVTNIKNKSGRGRKVFVLFHINNEIIEIVKYIHCTVVQEL